MNLQYIVCGGVTLKDFILKYTLRDSIIGFSSYIPGTVGVALRMLVYKVFAKKMGKGVLIKRNVKVYFPERLEVGDYASLNENVVIDASGGVEIGDHTRIAINAAIISQSHNYSRTDIPLKLQGKELGRVVIGRDVWIGCNSIILYKVTIGDGAVVGANSLVNSDVEPYTVVAGSPAKKIKMRGQDD